MALPVNEKYEIAKSELEYRLEHNMHSHSAEYLRIKKHDSQLIPYFWTLVLNTVGGMRTDDEAKQIENYYFNYLAQYKNYKHGRLPLSKEFLEISFVASKIIDNLTKKIFPPARDFIYENNKALCKLITHPSQKIRLTPAALKMIQTEHSDDQLQALKRLHDVLENSSNSQFKLALSMAFYSLEISEKLNSSNEATLIAPLNHEILLRVLEVFHLDLAKELEGLFTKYFIIEQIEKYFKADYDFDPHLYMDAESIF